MMLNTCSLINHALVSSRYIYISPLLFPERPYHRLLKDDKLISEQINNPVNDCEKAKDLLLDEIARWNSLSDKKRKLFASILKDKKELKDFLAWWVLNMSMKD
jgi:ATP-dependent DNA helicase RecQ